MAMSVAGPRSRSNQYAIPERMKAWVLGGPEELDLVEKPVPQPGPAEVLVRVDAIAVCATDSRKRLLARSALPHAAGDFLHQLAQRDLCLRRRPDRRGERDLSAHDRLYTGRSACWKH